jgi:hypothetical protein
MIRTRKSICQRTQNGWGSRRASDCTWLQGTDLFSGIYELPCFMDIFSQIPLLLWAHGKQVCSWCVFFLFSIQAEGPKLLICCLFVKRDHLELWMEGNLLPQLSFTRIHLISAAHVWALYGLLCNQFKACDATWEWCHRGCGLLSVFSRDVWCFCILYFVQYHSSNPSTVVMVFQVLSTFCFQNCVEFLTVNVLGQGFI